MAPVLRFPSAISVSSYIERIPFLRIQISYHIVSRSSQISYDGSHFTPMYRSFLQFARALYFGWPQVCVDTCNTALENAVWRTANATDDYYTGFCLDILRFESMWLCASVHCSPDDIQSGVDYYVEDCVTNAGIQLPSYDDTIASYRSNFSDIPVLSIADISPDTIVNTTVLPGDDIWQLASHAEVSSVKLETHKADTDCLV